MEATPWAFKESSVLRVNLKYGAVGILVGIVICTCIAVFDPDGISARGILFNILFSFFITLSITNIVVYIQCRLLPSKTAFWKFVVTYYACNVIGMVFGIELTYLIVSLLYGTKIQLLRHFTDYRTSLVIVMIVGTLILLYNLQKISAAALLKDKENDLVRLDQLKTQAELQALQSKINPHFLYNALNSIASLIHEDAGRAEDMTLKLSKFFRYSLNTMQENFCSVRDEVEILKTYLEIEKVRFGTRIDFTISVEDADDQLIPRFLLQPLVENALKHGLKDVRESGRIKVAISRTGGRIEIFIYDNGAPFPDDLIPGYGLQSTFDKLSLLYKDDYDIQMVNAPQKYLRISMPIT